MRAILDPLTIGTAGGSAAGIVLAQVVQSPTVTLGTIALAVIGLATIAVRGYFEGRRLQVELDIARRLGSCSSRCPFSADGRPACIPSMPASTFTRPHSEGS